MLKIVAVVDKENSALDRLAKGVIPYHDNLDYSVVDVHPKRPDPSQLNRFENLAAEADIIDFQYFKTAQSLLNLYPWLKDKKLILTHNNPYSYKDDKWEWADMNVGNNREIVDGLKEQGTQNVEYVPITVDANFWTYKREWQPNKTVIMVANRIESKKGILPVAIACADAGLRLVLVGAISDRNYFHSIIQTGCVEFHEQISDEKLRELYYQSTIHVCNSVDGFESGTMPILESMLCGVPVLTRRIGHVPDLYNEENMVIYEGNNEDTIAIRHELERMLLDPKKLEEMRGKAWNTAKTRNFERRAYEYQRLYRKVLSDKPSVSVIVPINDNPEVIRACLNAIANQDYPNLEIIICDDLGSQDDPRHINCKLARNFAKTVSFPVRYIYTAGIEEVDAWDSEFVEIYDYGLARARNQGIIEATGDIVVFCDQRQIMAPNCVTELVNSLIPRTWVYGNKGRANPDFVENLSAIYRSEIITAGMFCERITQYGGMTQEVRSRTRKQGIKHVYVESAKATPMGKSSNRNTKKLDIIKSKNTLFKMGL